MDANKRKSGGDSAFPLLLVLWYIILLKQVAFDLN